MYLGADGLGNLYTTMISSIVVRDLVGGQKPNGWVDLNSKVARELHA